MTKTSRERWESVALPRIDKLEAAATNLAKCGNARTYDFTDAEADTMIDRVAVAVDAVADAFGFEPLTGTAPAEAPAPSAPAPDAGDLFPHDLMMLDALRDRLEDSDIDGALAMLVRIRANVEVGKPPNGSVTQRADD